MSKDVKFNEEAKEPLIEGAKILADVVRVTMGPKGRNVLINKNNKYLITKDGVTAAKSTKDSGDRLVDLGMKVIEDVASKTNDVAGDGTTTATVLASEIISEGYKNIVSGASPNGVKKGIDIATKVIVDNLKKQSKKVKTNNDIKDIATVSANGEEEIGTLISDAIKKIGKNGVIQLEESKSIETYVSIVNGMQIDRGYISPVFMTDITKREAVLENAYVLMVDKKISSLKEILPILEIVASENGSLLIVADDVDGEALSTMVLNKSKGLKVAAIKAPGFDEARMHLFTDLALFTGGEYIPRESRSELENADLTLCGKAKKIIITDKSTTFIGGEGHEDDIKERTIEIKALLDNTDALFLREKYESRIAKLNNGIAILNVGGQTEAEMKERKDRAEDALNATKSAIQEGVIPGGGIALLRVLSSLEKLKGYTEDEQVGINVMKKAITKPFKQIIENGGIESSVIFNEIMKGKKDYGYNSYNNKYENFFESGIVDPLKVTRSAIESATSIAGLFLTIECVLFE